MRLDDPEDRTVACAEYVLGTLDDPDREAFVAALARDPALQAEVGYWQDRLLGLAARVPAQTPTPELWRRIEAGIAGGAGFAGAARPPAVSATPAATMPRPARPQVPPPSLWDRIGFWRFVSGVAVAASVLLATTLWLRPPPVAEIQYVAVLHSPDQQRAGWVVRASDRGPVKLVPIGNPGQIPAGHYWHFWTKGKDAAGPTSLGQVPPAGQVEVPRQVLPDLGDQQLFEITLEPLAGAPSARPTGPILYVGRASAI